MRRFQTTMPLGVAAGLCLTLAPGCAAPGLDAAPLRIPLEIRQASDASGAAFLIRTPSGAGVTLDEAADELADADVVFLGELHDNGDGHAVQLALTQELAQRRGDLILSMEMFERDSQPTLDLYLSGAIDEPTFLETARLWSNYQRHYRGAVEFCRDNGFPVLAANVYRPIAARVAKRGLASGIGDPWAARSVSAPRDGEYRRRFNEVMGSHGDGADQNRLDNVFAAQCIKDDTMAESIADALAQPRDGAGAGAPIVVHWNGRFHSDFGLGTVERLRSRRPDLNIAVVSMITQETPGSALSEDELNQGHFVILVAPAN